MVPENTVDDGNRMMGPMFVTVGAQTEGSGTYSIQDLIPTGEVVPNGEETDDTAISLMKLNAKGGADGFTYYWRDGTFKISGRMKTVKGWYQPGSATKEDIQLTAGQAVWVHFPKDAKCSFTIAGEVPNGDIYMALRQGNSAVCNPQPVPTSIQKVEPYASEGVTVPNGENTDETAISLMKLNPKGGADGFTYYWRDGTFKISGRMKTVHGWYQPGSATQEEIPLNPGEGIWVYSPIDNIALDFPAAIKK